MPQRETVPYDGLRPVRPHSAAGWRMEPPVSVPVAIGARRAATAAAEPPEEPPGTRLRSQGFFTGPKYEVSLDDPMANSSMLVLPSETRPASECILRITVASYGETKLASIFEPQVVVQPSAQKMSFWATGMPVSGPAVPAAMRASAARAMARLFSRSTVTKALMSGFRRSMRSRNSVDNSTLEICFAARACDSSFRLLLIIRSPSAQGKDRLRFPAPRPDKPSGGL